MQHFVITSAILVRNFRAKFPKLGKSVSQTTKVRDTQSLINCMSHVSVFASCAELSCGEGAHQLHDTSNFMHFIIKETLFYTEYRGKKEYHRNCLKRGMVISYMV